jgi:hypothetical protein
VFDVNFHHFPQHEWSVILVFCGRREVLDVLLWSTPGILDPAADMIPKYERRSALERLVPCFQVLCSLTLVRSVTMYFSTLGQNIGSLKVLSRS